MRCNSFLRSALFAALAAAAYLPVHVLGEPLLGVSTGRALYLTGLLACYVVGLSPGGRPAAALVVGVLGLALIVGVDSLREVVLSLAVILGILRSGLIYPSRPARAIVTEAFLIGGGLAFACSLLGSSAFSVALAVWGFFLVQSTFFLCSNSERGADSTSGRDPFESAHARAMDLLGEGGF